MVVVVCLGLYLVNSDPVTAVMNVNYEVVSRLHKRFHSGDMSVISVATFVIIFKEIAACIIDFMLARARKFIRVHVTGGIGSFRGIYSELLAENLLAEGLDSAPLNKTGIGKTAVVIHPSAENLRVELFGCGKLILNHEFAY